MNKLIVAILALGVFTAPAVSSFADKKAGKPAAKEKGAKKPGEKNPRNRLPSFRT